ITVVGTIAGSGVTESVPVNIIAGGTGGDSLSATTGINLFYALNGDDTVTGGSGFDFMSGGAGTDILTGNGGGDFLSGGGNTDKFKYVAVTDSQPGLTNNAANYDTIGDFDSSSGSFNHSEGDQIDLSSFASGTFTTFK